MDTDLIKCHQFKIVNREFFDSLKEIETSKAKSYSCMVWVQKSITEEDCMKLSEKVKELEVKQ
jgi:tRNA U54 and U55 pseudouridine synthase Pus10